MATTEVEVRIHSEGADNVVRDLNKVEKAQKKVEKQQDSVNKTNQKGEVRLNALADAFDNMGLTGAAGLFSVGEGVNELGLGFKGLGGAIAGAGIGAFIALVPVLVEGIGKVVNVVRDWGNATEAVGRELDKSAAKAQDGIVDLNRYNNVLMDVNASEQARLKALEKLTELGVDTEGVTLDNVAANEKYKASIDATTEALLNQARAEAAREMLVELERERLEIIQGLESDRVSFTEILLGKTGDLILKTGELGAIEEKRNALMSELTKATEKQLEVEAQVEERKDRAAQKEVERIAQRVEMKKAELREVGELQTRAILQQIETEDMGAMEVVDIRETLTNRLIHFANNAAESADTYAAGLSAVTELVGNDSKRAFQITKAAQIAETIVSTYAAAQKAYNSQLTIPSPDAPIRAAIAAGTSVAQGLARVAAIRATTFEGGGGSASTGGVRTPTGGNFLVPQTTQQNAGQAAPAPVQAYVVGQQITNQQALDNELAVRSRL
jgi:hypothetical protein